MIIEGFENGPGRFGKTRLMWDLHCSYAANILGHPGPIAPQVTPRDLRLAVNILKRISIEPPRAEWSDLKFEWSSSSVSTPDLLRHVFDFFNRSPVELVREGLIINNRDYRVLERERAEVGYFSSIGVPSTICSGTPNTDERRAEVEELLERTDALSILDPSLRLLLRPSTIRNSAISKALFHGVRHIAGEDTVSIDDDKHALDVIEAVLRMAFGKRIIACCSLDKDAADALARSDKRALPDWARPYVDREKRIYGDYSLLRARIMETEITKRSVLSPSVGIGRVMMVV